MADQFNYIVPKTVKNFIRLSTSDHFPSYKDMWLTLMQTVLGQQMLVMVILNDSYHKTELPKSYCLQTKISIFGNVVISLTGLDS